MELIQKDGRIIYKDCKDQEYFPIFRWAIFLYSYIVYHEDDHTTLNYMVATPFLNLISESLPCMDCAKHLQEFEPEYTNPLLRTFWYRKNVQDLHKHGEWKWNINVSPDYFRIQIKDTIYNKCTNNYYNPFVLALLETLIYFDVDKQVIKSLMDMFAYYRNQWPAKFTTYSNYIGEYNNIVKEVVIPIISKEWYETIYINQEK